MAWRANVIADFLAGVLPPSETRTELSISTVHWQTPNTHHRLSIRSRPGSALAQGNAIVRQPGGDRVEADAFTGFAHQVGEGGQRHQLAVGEEVGEGSQPVQGDTRYSGIIRKIL